MITNLTIGRYGRLGNMLFQVAAVIGIARKSGQPFCFKPLVNYDHKERFGSSEDVELDKYFVHELPRIDRPETHFNIRNCYGWQYHEVRQIKGDWSIEGHFQSEKYFKHSIDEVRHYMTMKGERDLTGRVIIHVRRGDYDNNYHPILGREYYYPAMLQFPPDTLFHVYSDDPIAAMEMLKGFGSGKFTVSNSNYIESFKEMKRSSGFICANSSFSLMPAILSEAPDKKIICPSNWFGPAWGEGYREQSADIYPENSLVI